MSGLCIKVEGIGVWSPQLANFDSVQQWLAGASLAGPIAKPPATALSANERRRAPESVLVAIEVAAQAIAMSGRTADNLACVFASAHGDQATTDYLCRVLARAPAELSPTRFHNSVHNATAGYWTIATDCRAPSSALCAGSASFGAGLLEAATQACADNRPVLLVCSDTAGIGPLGELTACAMDFGCALVLSPATDAHAWQLRTIPATEIAIPAGLPSPAQVWMRENPSAACLPLLAMLAHGGGECRVAVSERLGLQVQRVVSA